jgi:hypothetical protein
MARQPNFNADTAWDRHGFRRAAQLQKAKILESFRKHSERRHGENRREQSVATATREARRLPRSTLNRPDEAGELRTGSGMTFVAGAGRALKLAFGSSGDLRPRVGVRERPLSGRSIAVTTQRVSTCLPEESLLRWKRQRDVS